MFLIFLFSNLSRRGVILYFGEDTLSLHDVTICVYFSRLRGVYSHPEYWQWKGKRELQSCLISNFLIALEVTRRTKGWVEPDWIISCEFYCRPEVYCQTFKTSIEWIQAKCWGFHERIHRLDYLQEYLPENVRQGHRLIWPRGNLSRYVQAASVSCFYLTLSLFLSAFFFFQ